MSNLKHTPPHFQERNPMEAPLGLNNSESSAWTSGYNTALENTNAIELLEALMELSELVKNAGHDLWLEHSGSNNAIKKATE